MMNTERYTGLLVVALVALMGAGCAASNIEPVDIFPEDNCSQCRMAISEPQFASEIIDQHGQVYKFDDLGCMFTFRKKHGTMKINATYVKDYDTKEWIPYERAIIVETGLETPMGSGRVAFADEQRAKLAQQKYPSAKTSHQCSGTCCE